MVPVDLRQLNDAELKRLFYDCRSGMERRRPRTKHAHPNATGVRKARQLWARIAGHIALYGPAARSELARVFGRSASAVSQMLRQGSFRHWFEEEGGRVSLTSEGRLEALPPKG